MPERRLCLLTKLAAVRVGNVFSRYLQAISLSTVQYSLLCFLSNHEEVSRAFVVDSLQLGFNEISSAAVDLNDRGLIVRRAVTEGIPDVRYSISEAGRALLNVAGDLIASAEEELLANLTEEQIAAGIALLQELAGLAAADLEDSAKPAHGIIVLPQRQKA